MDSSVQDPISLRLLAELGAAFAARKASLEYERGLVDLDQRDRLGRELFELRSAEAMLEAAKGPEGSSLLGPLAQAAADDLEQVARQLYLDMDEHSAATRPALLRTVSALLRTARLAEARTRAFMTAARQGVRLEGFDEAIELAPETEQLLLALRRFQALIERGGAWDVHDAEQLYLRALSVPGRLRLEAASLRSGAAALSGVPLPPDLAAACEPFAELGLDAPLRLAWAAAGFSAEECVDWREAGLKRPAQAMAWHSHGFDPAEAAAWMRADMLPDEAGAFVFCGVSGLSEALELRRALGDVEHLLVWRRAGYSGSRVQALLAVGIRTPDQARAQGQMPEQSAPGLLSVAPELPDLPPISVQAAAVAPAPAPEPVPEAPVPAVEPQAWMGWGAWDEAAGIFDAVPGTEGGALPGQTYAPASLQAEPEWDKALAALRAKRGAAPVAGAWHLRAQAPHAARLIFGARFEGEAPPWAEAVDYSPAETWRKRWARKTEEWGEEGAKSPCHVGRALDGAWWVALEAGHLRCPAGLAAPQAIQPEWPTGAWRQAFEDFCLKMEIKRPAPHWQLFAVAADEP